MEKTADTPELQDPFKKYNGPPVTQEQIDAHDPSQALDDVHKWGKSQYDKLGPMFKNYFNKAMEHAKAAPGAVGNAAGNVGNTIKNTDFFGNGPNEDSKSFAEYKQMLDGARNNSNTINKSGQLINQIHQVQLQIQHEYNNFIQINSQAKQFATNEGRFILNQQSQPIFTALKNSYGNIDLLIQRLQKLYEAGFDNIGHYKSSNTDLGAIKPIKSF